MPFAVTGGPGLLISTVPIRHWHLPHDVRRGPPSALCNTPHGLTPPPIRIPALFLLCIFKMLSKCRFPEIIRDDSVAFGVQACHD